MSRRSSDGALAASVMHSKAFFEPRSHPLAFNLPRVTNRPTPQGAPEGCGASGGRGVWELKYSFLHTSDGPSRERRVFVGRKIGATFWERLVILCQKLVRTCQAALKLIDQGSRQGGLPARTNAGTADEMGPSCRATRDARRCEPIALTAVALPTSARVRCCRSRTPRLTRR